MAVVTNKRQTPSERTNGRVRLSADKRTNIEASIPYLQDCR